LHRDYGTKVLELLNPEWTLKYDTPIQYYMFAAAYGLISAIVLYPSAKIKSVVSVLVLGLVLLLLKGRTLIAGTLAAGLLISSCLASAALGHHCFLLGLILSSVQVDLAMGGRIALSARPLLRIDCLAGSLFVNWKWH